MTDTRAEMLKFLKSKAESEPKESGVRVCQNCGGLVYLNELPLGTPGLQLLKEDKAEVAFCRGCLDGKKGVVVEIKRVGYTGSWS